MFTFDSNVQKILCLFSLANVSICVMSTFSHMNPWGGEHHASNNIDEAIMSREHRYSLIISLSMSLPMLFEFLLRMLVEKNIKFASSVLIYNAAVIVSQAIPNSITLFYIIPHNNKQALGIVNNVRFTFISWIFLSFMNRRVFQGWSPRLSLLLHFLTCIFSLPPFYKLYSNADISYSMEIIVGYVLPLLSIMVFCTLCFYWILFIRKETNNKELQTQLCLGNIYICAYVMTFFSLITLRLSYPTFNDWYQYDTTFLTSTTISFSVFYSIIVVFERRVVHEDTIKREVT